MTTLVHTSPEGPAGQQLSLLTSTTRARSLVQTLDSSLVDNASLVAGATVTAALNNLSTTIGALNSNQVLNASGVAGVSVTDALNELGPGSVISSLGWNGAAPLVLTLMPAGHPAGLYEISFEFLIRAIALTGTVTKTVNYSAPGVGAVNTSPSTTGSLTGVPVGRIPAPGNQFYPTVAVMSTGVANIDLMLTPAAITGAPSFDVYAYRKRLAS